MSKVYKAIIYIDDINGKFNNIEAVKQEFENNIEDIILTFEKVEEKDTTKYLEDVGDDYAWNTTDEYTRTIILHNLFAVDEVE